MASALSMIQLKRIPELKSLLTGHNRITTAASPRQTGNLQEMDAPLESI
jgi:hypothetical protein